MKRQPMNMFAATNEDLPLFSGACVDVEVAEFQPVEVQEEVKPMPMFTALPTTFYTATFQRGTNTMTTRITPTYKPVRYVPGRGLDVSASGLFDFGSGNGLVMFVTKKEAAAHGKRWGWPAKYACVVFTRLYGGYAVAQFLADTVRFLAEDGTVIEAPLVNENMPNPRAPKG